jgi:hypothetical protein
MKRLVLIALTAFGVTTAAVLGVTAPASAAWNNVLYQSDMIHNWCSLHEHKALGGGNWQDGYWCQQPGYSRVTQTTIPEIMCKWLLQDQTVRFHIFPGTTNGACAYWY